MAFETVIPGPTDHQVRLGQRAEFECFGDQFGDGALGRVDNDTALLIAERTHQFAEIAATMPRTQSIERIDSLGEATIFSTLD